MAFPYIALRQSGAIAEGERLISIISIWGLGVGVGSYFGLFSTFPLPWFALLVAIGITAPVMIYYEYSTFRAYIQGLHLNYLTVFHLWRVPAALASHIMALDRMARNTVRLR